MFGRCVSLKTFKSAFAALSMLFLLAEESWAAKDVTVITDGAIVYRKADFDSPILGYFQAGKQIKISDNKFGGAFFRVRFKQGVIGYIADVDVSGGVTPPPAAMATGEPAKAEQKRKGPESILTTTYLGLQGGVTRYAEIINKVEYRDSITTYGLKLSAPFGLFDGPFTFDLNLMSSFSAPSYYKGLSQTPAEGYLLLVSPVLNVSLFEFGERRGLCYIGGGPLLSYSNYMVEVSGAKLELSELRAGGVFVLGLGFDLGGAIFKLEPKYIVEKASYNSIDLALQIAL